jgi:hypothetical protein
MYRTLALAAALAALAVPAFAQDITIHLNGKNKAQILAEIHAAAGAVCWHSGYKALDEQHMCAAEAEQQARADLAALRKG